MNFKNSDKKIENTEKIVAGIFWYLKIIFLEVFENFKQVFRLFQRDIIKWSWTRKVATIIFLLLILLPMWYWYFKTWKSIYTYFHNIIHYEQNITVLKGEYEDSIRNFLDTYNQKYWIDCDWILEANVDMWMDRYGTEKKDAPCNYQDRMQIFPITIEPPITDGKQSARVWWKAIVVMMDGTNIRTAWYQRYELWRKMDWDIAKWKFNAFSQDDKERLK